MIAQRGITAFLLFFLLAPLAHARDLRQEYVGKSSCTPDLAIARTTYGIRLDKTRNLRLEAYALPEGTLLAIVKNKGDADRCGVILDAIQSKANDPSFLFDCTDIKDPSSVAVGTWPAAHPKTSGSAVEAWKIDLNTLRFQRITTAVSCRAGDYAGADDGSDLVIRARQRSQRN
jgi:hypothetical protein